MPSVKADPEPKRGIASYSEKSGRFRNCGDEDDETLWVLMNIIGPAILLILLVWLVLRSRRGKNQTVDTTVETEAATRDEYADEERRRRDGTDGL